jgi:myo-inositol 2-dehydrogenase / D-chiro-inositol 1-dehydrogenase
VRLGLLGCGNIARWMHLPALRSLPGATLVAAADPDAGARDRARRLVRGPIYERAEELLARDDIGAVVICAPSRMHAALAIAAADAGKHFYLEKPIATTAADGCRVLEATGRAGVSAAIGFNRRLHPLYEQAREVLARGSIGRVRAVQTVWCEPIPLDRMPPWKRQRSSGGGVLLDLASHHFDQLRWLLDDEIVSVDALLRSELSEHDTARVELETAGGVAVQGLFSFRSELADSTVFLGEHGTLRLDRHSPVLSLELPRRLGYGVRRRRVAPTPAAAAWRLRRLFRPSADPSYRRSLRAFLDLVGDRPSRAATLMDGLRSLELVLAAEDAARLGEPKSVERQMAELPCARC